MQRGSMLQEAWLVARRERARRCIYPVLRMQKPKGQSQDRKGEDLRQRLLRATRQTTNTLSIEPYRRRILQVSYQLLLLSMKSEQRVVFRRFPWRALTVTR